MGDHSTLSSDGEEFIGDPGKTVISGTNDTFTQGNSSATSSSDSDGGSYLERMLGTGGHRGGDDLADIAKARAIAGTNVDTK